MEKQESGIKIVAVLVIIAMASAVLLAYVNNVTRGPIAMNKKAETQRAVKMVLRKLGNITFNEAPEALQVDGSRVRYFQAYSSGGDTIGFAFIVKAPNGFSSDFDLIVGVDGSGKVLDTYVLDHKETPGLGDNMRKEVFKKQFRGRTLQNTNWKVKKDGGDIDALTAATITSRAFTHGVLRALLAQKKLTKGIN